MDFEENIKKLSVELPEYVRIVVVSKTRTHEEIMKVYSTGHRVFGENRVQELVTKKEALPDDIEWHMVGHLQSNKVKYIAPFISLIHSVDSARLLKTISKEALKNNRVIDCLLQVHIAREESKFGFSEEEITELFASYLAEDYPGIRICGLMGMATFTGDENLIRSEFRYLAELYERTGKSFLNKPDYFNELSMGMSGDYLIAVEEGSTMVRVGSLVFGERSGN